MRFFIITTRGLENITLTDILESIGNIRIVSQSYRIIIFDYYGNPENLLSIKSADDVFIFCKIFKGRAALIISGLRFASSSILLSY